MLHIDFSFSFTPIYKTTFEFKFKFRTVLGENRLLVQVKSKTVKTAVVSGPYRFKLDSKKVFCFNFVLYLYFHLIFRTKFKVGPARGISKVKVQVIVKKAKTIFVLETESILKKKGELFT